MKIFYFAVVASLVVAANAFSQNARPGNREPWDWTKYQKAAIADEPEHQWAVSAGVAIADNTFRFPSLGLKSDGTSYGGYIGAEQFVLPSLALRAELTVFSESQSFAGVSATETYFIITIGPKFYPLQLTSWKQSRFQPFARAAIGGIFYDLSSSVASANADPAAVIGITGGAEFSFTDNLALTAEGGYYTTLGDSTVNVAGASTPFNQDGLIFTAGLRYKF